MDNLLPNIKGYILDKFGLITNSRKDVIIKNFILNKQISKHSKLNKSLTEELINQITVNETYFFIHKK